MSYGRYDVHVVNLFLRTVGARFPLKVDVMEFQVL